MWHEALHFEKYEPSLGALIYEYIHLAPSPFLFKNKTNPTRKQEEKEEEKIGRRQGGRGKKGCKVLGRMKRGCCITWNSSFLNTEVQELTLRIGRYSPIALLGVLKQNLLLL